MAKNNKQKENSLASIFNKEELQGLAYTKFIQLMDENKVDDALSIIKKIGVGYNDGRSTSLIAGIEKLKGKKQLQFVKQLLKNKVNPNVGIEFRNGEDENWKNRAYNTIDNPSNSTQISASPLSAALYSDSDTSFEVFKLLVECGANYNVKVEGKSLLEIAQTPGFGYSGNNLLIAKYLLEKEAEDKLEQPNKKTKQLKA